MTEKIILGIDPGTNIMGYGVLKVQGKQAEMLALGVIDLRKYADHYLKLGHIFERVSGIIDAYLPDEMAIEAPFFGKNVQSMLKLGRSQGVAMAAAIPHKEQVADMLRRMLKLSPEEMGKFLDATDALGAAYCHFLQMDRPETDKKYRSWKDFANKNQERVKGR